MLTITAGNTSPPIRASSETDTIIVRPLTSTSKGYAEISWDATKWVQWRASWVSSETHLVAGSNQGALPYVRFVCVAGTIEGEVIGQNFTGGQDMLDALNASGLTPTQMTAFAKNAGPLSGSNVATWVAPSASLLTPVGPFTVLDVPSPYGPRGTGVVATDSPIHPAALYIPQGFAGYKYVLAFTPYPGGDSQYENPCVVVSNDGLKFIVPPGGANPVIPRPALPGYNADTHIVLSPDHTKVYLIWRERNGGGSGLNRLMICHTTDLVTWSSPVAIKSALITAKQDFASPSLWYDPVGNQWVCISHNLDSDNDEVQRMTCAGDNIYGAWGDPVNVTITGTWWHSYFTRLIDGRILGIIMTNTSGAAGALSFAESTDGGQSFSVIPSEFRYNQWYRSTFFLCPEETGRLDLVLTYYLDSYNLIRIPCNYQKTARTLANRISPVGSPPQAGVLLSDSFNRADGAIGNADTGQTPTVTGTVTISGNAATLATTGNNRAVWEAGSANAIARLKVRTVGSEFWLVARFTNTSNFWRLGLAAGGTDYQLQKIIAGTATSVASLKWRPTNGDLLSFACSGNSISASVNGIELFSTIDSDSNAGTQFGIQGTGAIAAFFEAIEVLPA